MKIYLARHGQTDWNLHNKIQGWSDVPLNKTGLEQAKVLGESLRGVKFDKVYCSPLRRAKETAEVALATAGALMDIDFEKNLVERGFGEFEGKSGEEYDAAKYWDFLLNCDAQGVESVKEMMARGEKVKMRILGENKKEATVLVVGHGASLRALYFNLVGFEVGKTNLREFYLKNGEVRVVEI